MLDSLPVPTALSRSAPRSAPMRPVLDTAPTRILLLDDEESIREAIGRLLRSRGYDVVAVATPAEAFAALEMDRFAVMLCDVRMPEMSGLEVVPRAIELDADLAIVMLTAVNDAATATDALGHGAMDYLVKPVELGVLQGAVERAARRRLLEIERRRVEAHIREEVAARTVELDREQAALRDLTVGVAEALINAMEAKNVYLRGHSRRVADQAASMAEELGLEEDVVENVRLAGRLHDVGKIGIRETVLNKPGALSEDEFEHVKDHVRISMEILAPLKHIPVVLQYVHDHHEHFDGSGYPRGLHDQEISMGGRILAACDAFDALTSQRAFREAMEPRETLDYLEGSVGRLLDPQVFAALKKVVLRRRTLTFIEDVAER